MLAIDESASSFCAREMRGTLSIASTVAFLAASACMRSGFCAGQMKLTSVCPSRISVTSSGLGARTLNTISAVRQIVPRSGAISAPAARYASSLNCALSPAQVSTATRNPALMSFSTTSGTVATRRSPANVSFGTPISSDIVRSPLIAAPAIVMRGGFLDRRSDRFAKIRRRCLAPKIGRARRILVAQHPLDGGDDAGGRVLVAQEVEHQRARPDLADRIGDAFAGDIRCRAVHGLEQRRKFALGIHVGRRRDAD